MSTRKKVLAILLIEDDRRRVEKFQAWLPEGVRAVVTKSAGTALGLLERDKGYVYAGICLDHDLQRQTVIASDNDLSGSTVVHAISRYISTDVPVLIHSQNLKRAQYMESKLWDAGFDVTRISMDQLDEKLFHNWLEDVKELWEENHDEE